MVALQGRDISAESVNEYPELECRVENKRARNMLVDHAETMANSDIQECVLLQGQLEKKPCSGGDSYLPFQERTQKRDGLQRIRTAYVKTEFPEGQSGHCVRSETRSGPGARWAQKSGLETRWTSPKKVHKSSYTFHPANVCLMALLVLRRLFPCSLNAPLMLDNK